MSKRMKHSKTVKIRFTNPEYQAVKITAHKKVILYQNYYEFFVLLPVPNQIHCSILEPLK